jgi:trans-4-hydroxy-L-proline dehydratase
MSERVARLRQQSLDARPTLSAERARLLTDFYLQPHELVSAPMLRAQAFAYLMKHKTVVINPGELIVGEKGPAPKNAPTFPELCCHSLEDLDILDSREKTSFAVSPEDRAIYEETIIPYWKGKSLREAIFREMTEEWLSAYEAGIFTEFMEQRAPGHTVLDDKIYRKGMFDFIDDIDRQLDGLDWVNDPEAYAKSEQLKAMRLCCQALVSNARRYAAQTRDLSEIESDPARRQELLRIADVCEWVPAHAPRNFWEALQSYWFVHLGVTTELNTWDAFNPGRLDQHLLPFYQQGLADGSLSRDSAEELLQCFWIKFNNQPAPPKVGVTAQESGTYTDFALINTGGVKVDGSDAVNEVTYLLLDVIEGMRLLQPSSCLQLSKKNPDRFLKRAARIIRTGFGQPSIFNTDVIVQELVRQGKSVEDARCGGASGCVEVGAFGKEAYILTGYLNLVKILELALHDGLDPRTGRQLGPRTGDPREFEDFEALFAAFEKQLDYFVNVKIRGNQVIERLYATYMPAPLLSVLTDDCIARGKDYHDGGARYNTTYIQGVGLGSLTDALTALRCHVYDQKDLAMDELVAALENDYAGHEALRLKLLNATPKYGNDDDYADEVMRRIFEAYYRAVDGRKNTRGGEYHINLLPTTVHVYFGSVIGATPDGRKAGKPLSEGISPVQGSDRRGPTAVVKSAAKMDHARTGGTLLNQKLSPSLLQSDGDIERFVGLVRGYFKLDGHHIQFNVVDAATLRKAQQNPEQHRNLIVRVAGYSDYFCDLSPALQEEIIARTEHQAY